MSTGSDPLCRSCRAPMEKGVLLDRGHSGERHAPKWAKGNPREKKFLGFDAGLDVDEKAALCVVTWRCPRCGVLESYARPG